jgi:hypothetical protein
MIHLAFSDLSIFNRPVNVAITHSVISNTLDSRLNSLSTKLWIIQASPIPWITHLKSEHAITANVTDVTRTFAGLIAVCHMRQAIGAGRQLTMVTEK